MSPLALDNLVVTLTTQYGPIIGVEEAAKIARRSKQTIYDWSSRGLLDPIRSGRTGPIALELDGFVRFVFADRVRKTNKRMSGV